MERRPLTIGTSSIHFISHRSKTKRNGKYTGSQWTSTMFGYRTISRDFVQSSTNCPPTWALRFRTSLIYSFKNVGFLKTFRATICRSNPNLTVYNCKATVKQILPDCRMLRLILVCLKDIGLPRNWGRSLLGDKMILFGIGCSLRVSKGGYCRGVVGRYHCTSKLSSPRTLDFRVEQQRSKLP